jgi:hypothetical protein
MGKEKDIFPIKKLIEVFEKAIPVYQKAVDEKWNYDKLRFEDIEVGLCFYFNKKLNVDIAYVMNNYYINYIDRSVYLFNLAYRFKTTQENINNCILPRLQFMKSEVKDLKKLLKKGYTHI